VYRGLCSGAVYACGENDGKVEVKRIKGELQNL
jgi:hypothetical protein